MLFINAMKQVVFAAVAIGMWVAPVSQSLRQPEQGVVQSGGAPGAQKSKEPAQSQQSADSEAIRDIASAIAQANQQHADDLKAAAAEKNQEIAIEGKLVNYTGLLVLVGGIQFIALLGQGVVFFFTLRTLNRQTRILQGHGISMRDAADASRRSAEVAEQALVLTERANVLLDAMTIGSLIPEGIPTVRFKNFGRTLAKNVVFTCYLNVGEAFKTGRDATNPVFLGATDTQDFGFPMFKAWLPEDGPAQIKDGRMPLTFYVKAAYDDVFGNPHISEYRGRLMLSSLKFTTEHQSTD